MINVSNRATISDTCPCLVRRRRLWCGATRHGVAPYRACNMHVSIRTLSNISFRSIYSGALSRGRLSLRTLFNFPFSAGTLAARTAQTSAPMQKGVRSSYISNYYDPEGTTAGKAGWNPNPSLSLVRLTPAPGAFNRYVGARLYESCSIVRRGA